MSPLERGIIVIFTFFLMQQPSLCAPKKDETSSLRRRPESRNARGYWIPPGLDPGSAGMTLLGTPISDTIVLTIRGFRPSAKPIRDRHSLSHMTTLIERGFPQTTKYVHACTEICALSPFFHHSSAIGMCPKCAISAS